MGLIDAITAVAGPRCLDDCDEWCAGLPLESIRILESGELDLLRQQVNAQFSWQRAVSISVAFVFVGLYCTTLLFPNPIDFSMMAGAAALMGAFVVWLLFEPGSWLRRYRALEMDLASGIVHRFSGTKFVGPLEVLPASEVVYHSNSFSLKKWRRQQIVAVAKTPPIASIASDWLLPVSGAIANCFSGKRELSTAERSEIRRWAGQVLDQRRRHAVSYVFWAALLGWLSRWGNPDLFYAALAFTGYSGSKICAEIRLFLALRRDADGGMVVINCRARVKDGSLTAVGNPAEFLPAAKLKWTEDGVQANWRKLP